MTQENKNNYLKKLINGDISLSITYWLWFVCVLLFIRYLFVDYMHSPIYFTLSFIYAVFIFVCVYRSANKYTGSKFWSFIAKTMVTINLFFSIVSINDKIKITYFNDYVISSEINNFKEQLPIKIDSYSELVNISKDEKDIFYTYKLSTISMNDSYDFTRFKKQIQDSLCEEEYTLKLLKKDYILNYKYLDKNDKTITNILTNKEDCGKNIYDLDILKEILEKEKSIF